VTGVVISEGWNGNASVCRSKQVPTIVRRNDLDMVATGRTSLLGEVSPLSSYFLTIRQAHVEEHDEHLRDSHKGNQERQLDCRSEEQKLPDPCRICSGKAKALHHAKGSY
jgi:hypothetical protein